MRLDLHDVLRARGMEHVADLLTLASERPWIRNEFAEAAVDDGAVAEAGAVPSPESPAGEAGSPPPAAATETAPAWSPSDPVFRDAVAAEAEAVLQGFLAQQQAQQVQQPQQQAGVDAAPDYDPFDPDSVRAYMAWERQQTINELRNEISPLRQTFEQQAQAQQEAAGEQIAKDMIADDIARNGDVTEFGREAIPALASMFVDNFAARYGQGPRAAEAAIQKAGEVVRSIEKAAGEKALQAHVNRNAQLAGASGEPGVGAGSGVQAITGAIMSPHELALKYGQSAAALRS